jgi:hypothetical protein
MRILTPIILLFLAWLPGLAQDTNASLSSQSTTEILQKPPSSQRSDNFNQDIIAAKINRRDVAETAGTNTYTASVYGVGSYTNDLGHVLIRFKTASTGASTLNINTIGAKKIYKTPSSQAVSGDIVDEQVYSLAYDTSLDGGSGGWLMVGAGSGSGSTTPTLQQVLTEGSTLTSPFDITIDGGAALSIVSDSDADLYIAVGEDAAIVHGPDMSLQMDRTTNDFVFSDSRVLQKGIEYAATGYVTQAHSLTDKEYVDAIRKYPSVDKTTSFVASIDDAGTNHYNISPSGDVTITFPDLTGQEGIQWSFWKNVDTDDVVFDFDGETANGATVIPDTTWVYVNWSDGQFKVAGTNPGGGGGSGSVVTVTGDGVDNTDPTNPVISFPTLKEAIEQGNVIDEDESISVDGDVAFSIGAPSNPFALQFTGAGTVALNVGSDAPGDYHRRSSTGILERRTPSQVLSDIGGVSTTLNSTQILVGNGSNVATAVNMSGAITISNTGVTSYAGTVPINRGGTNSTSFTSGSIPYYNGTSITENNTNLFWDNANGRLRVNNSGSSSFAAPQTGTLLHFISESASFNGRISLDSYVSSQATGSIFQGRTSRGTISSPSAATADQVLAAYGGDGYGATGFHGSSVGSFTVRSDGTMTDTSAPTYLTMSTTPSASSTSAERFRVGSAGQLGIGGANFGTSGQVIISAGSAAAPAWGTIGSGNVDNTIWKVGGNTLSGAAVFGSTSAQDITLTAGNANLKTSVNGTQIINIDASRGILFADGGGTITGTTAFDFRSRTSDTRVVRFANQANSMLWTLGSTNGEMFLGNNSSTYIGPATRGSVSATGPGITYRATQAGGHYFLIGASNMGTYSQIDENTTAGSMLAVSSTTGQWHRVRPSFDNTTSATSVNYTLYEFSPTFNMTGGSTTMRILDFNPTETSLTGTTKYGFTFGGTGWLNGVNMRTPTASLHIGAGTTSIAPLKLTSGTNLTTPADGAMEYDASHLYFTIGSTRYQIDQQPEVNRVLNSTVTSANNVGTGEDDLYSYTIPASTFSSDKDEIEGTFNGIIGASGNNKRVRVRFGSALIFDSGAFADATGSDWSLEIQIYRVDATNQKAIVKWSSSNAAVPTLVDYTTATETMSGTISFRVTGEATNTNEVVLETGSSKFFKSE